MSRSNRRTHIDDSENQPERYYVGYHEPEPDVSVQKPDKYSYDRWKASRRLGLAEWDLADTPDYDNRLDNIDEGT